MNLNDVLLAAEDRLRLVTLHADALVVERDELLIFMRVYDRLTRSQPSPAAQTGPRDGAPASAAPDAVECAEAPELQGEVGLAAPDTNSPEGASEAGGLDSHSLTEIALKSRVQVPPVVEIDDKGGPTGMGRSDSGESTAAAGETGLASSPAPVRLMDRIREAYALHPDWTAGQFAKAMPDVKYNSLSTMLTLVRKEAHAVSGEPEEQGADAPEASEGGEDENRLTHGDGEGVDAALPKRRLLKDDILELARAAIVAHHKAHPGHTITQAAEALGMARAPFVRMSREMGLRWATIQEPADETSPVPLADGDGEGGLATDALPGPTNVLPFEPTRFGSPAVVHKPMQRAPRGKKFRLTDGEGNYLRFDCRAMVAGTKNTWEGTESQLVACRRTFPLARGLHERAVEKVVRNV